MGSRSPILGLDGLRGLAILLVMLYHSSRPPDAAPLDYVLNFCTTFGWIGVDLFFVLSGFLITGILYDSKAGANYFRNFYARRFLRIFPLYYAFLLVSFLLLPHYTHDEPWYWLYASNLLIAIKGTWQDWHVDHAWSLAIEEQFYLVWPIVVLLLNRRCLILTGFGLMGLALAARAVMIVQGGNGLPLLVLTPLRIDGVAVGALIALWLRGAHDTQRLIRWARPAAVGAGLLIAGMGIRLGGFDAETFRSIQLVGLTLLAVLFGAILILAAETAPGSVTRRFLELPVLRMFGRYSYALYLFHPGLQHFIESQGWGVDGLASVTGSRLLGQLGFHAISLGVSLAAAGLSWHLYESRFLRLKGLFNYGAVGRLPVQGVAVTPIIYSTAESHLAHELRTWIGELCTYRDLLWMWTLREIRVRYKQSVLGAAWAILQPLSLTVIFTLVFSLFAKVPSDGVPYPIFAYTALLPWMLFSSATSFAIPSLINNMQLVTKIYFPKEILPLGAIGAALLDFVVASLVFAGMMVLYQIAPTGMLWWVPVLLVVQIALMAGLSLLAAGINVFYRDMRFVVPLVLQIWMFASPVIYSESVVPERVRSLYMLNPMAGILSSYRRVILQGAPPLTADLLVAAVSSFLLCAVGYVYFKRTEPAFADAL